eukprot:Gregarina_sp_Poly_1__1910@NODE_149_length_12634_cov_195_682741_g133_i0_p1_GENE_NODE_149_length_12634_cov_195_682741_g133_i0NODE_149_length_12634_cov_195_682741_g133_i0_p1_ORF_typecomplete_len915_score143_21C2/PF00168_30/17C2/PF00168_30/2_3_NODE_149_length_12634_cov_195_682741_g133_i0981212556
MGLSDSASPMKHNSSSQHIQVPSVTLPSPRSRLHQQISSLAVTLFGGVGNHVPCDKFVLVVRVGANRVASHTFTPNRNAFSVNQIFFFPWNNELEVRFTVLRVQDGQSDETIAQCRLSFPTPEPNKTVLRTTLPFLDAKNKTVWADCEALLDFGYEEPKVGAKKLKSEQIERLKSPDVSPPVRGVSPVHYAPNADLKFDLDYPFQGIRIHCYIGAGWKSLRGQDVVFAVGVGTNGLRCTERFHVDKLGGLKISRIFQFPFQRERRVKMIIADPMKLDHDKNMQVIAEAAYDTFDLVNGNVVTCKQYISFYDPLVGQNLGHMETLTEFVKERLQSSVLELDETSLSPANKRGTPSAAQSPTFTLEDSTSLIIAHNPKGNTTELCEISPNADAKTLLIQTLGVVELPNVDDVCSVSVCLGPYRSGTGAYYRVKNNLKAGVYELHRLPYGRQRFVKVLARIVDIDGLAHDGHGWIDLTAFRTSKVAATKVTLFGSDVNSTPLGAVRLRLEFVHDVLASSTPIKVDIKDVIDRTPMTALLRQLQLNSSKPPGKPPTVNFIRTFCVSSPLMSPRMGLLPSLTTDTGLDRCLRMLPSPSSEAHPGVPPPEIVLLQLAAFRNLPDLDGVKQLRLQFVARVGSRTSLVSPVQQTSGVNPDYESLVFRLPLFELRHVTLDIFDRTMPEKPVYIGRSVIDTAVLKRSVVGKYEPLIGMGSTFCLYAIEAITPDAVANMTTPCILTELDKVELPVEKLALRNGSKASETSSADDSPDLLNTSSPSTLCVKLQFISGIISPFPFSKFEMRIRLETNDLKVTSHPFKVDAEKSAVINQIVKVPHKLSKFGALQLCLLANSNVTPSEVIDSKSIDIRSANPVQQEQFVKFEQSQGMLLISFYTIEERRRCGSCQAVDSLLRMPGLVSA